jgi:hypothetical protein
MGEKDRLASIPAASIKGAVNSTQDGLRKVHPKLPRMFAIEVDNSWIPDAQQCLFDH